MLCDIIYDVVDYKCSMWELPWCSCLEIDTFAVFIVNISTKLSQSKDHTAKMETIAKDGIYIIHEKRARKIIELTVMVCANF